MRVTIFPPTIPNFSFLFFVMSTSRVELSGGVLLTVGFGSWGGKSQIKEKQSEEASMLGLWPDAGKAVQGQGSR